MSPPGSVLLCTSQPTRLEQMLPLLRRSGLAVQSVDDCTEAIEKAATESFDLMILGLTEDDSVLADVVRAVRKDGSPCQSAGVLVVAAPELRLEAESWLGRGINRVVSSEGDEGRLLESIADLLHVSPRVELRTPVRLELTMVVGRVVNLAQTENLSRSGMLVRGGSRCAPGDRIGFDLELPGEAEAIRGRMVIVRRTDRWRERLEGFGAAFDSLSPEGRHRLEAFLERRLSVDVT